MTSAWGPPAGAAGLRPVREPRQTGFVPRHRDACAR